MSYILEKPYTERDRLDFIVKYNHNQGLFIHETKTKLVALEKNEIIVNDEVQINPYYEKEQRLFEIEGLLVNIQSQLDELDLKSIRALREGGSNSEGILYLELYQAQIDGLRKEYKDLTTEKAELEGGLNDITK